jgi:DNA-directed RNA polymerase specialized sigma24 family protein
VELVRRYSNHADLQERLSQAAHSVTQGGFQDQETSDETVSGQASRVRRVHDRLSADDIQQITQHFGAGTSKRVLADRFGISLSSVKLLLRQRGVKRNKRG